MTAQKPSVSMLKELETRIKDGLSRGSLSILVRCDNGKTVSIGQLCPIKLSEDFDIVV